MCEARADPASNYERPLRGSDIQACAFVPAGSLTKRWATRRRLRRDSEPSGVGIPAARAAEHAAWPARFSHLGRPRLALGEISALGELKVSLSGLSAAPAARSLRQRFVTLAPCCCCRRCAWHRGGRRNFLRAHTSLLPSSLLSQNVSNGRAKRIWYASSRLAHGGSTEIFIYFIYVAAKTCAPCFLCVFTAPGLMCESGERHFCAPKRVRLKRNSSSKAV